MKDGKLYQKLVGIIEVPVIETSEIWSKGIFLTERGLEPKIYIKKGLEIEKYSGVIIFTTNLIKNYDEAFKRRILANVEFGLPDVEVCKRI